MLVSDCLEKIGPVLKSASSRSFVLLISLCSIVFIVGCSVATMAVSPALAAAAEPLDVRGANPRLWNRPISFGPWQTLEVREGLQWGLAGPLLGVEVGFSRQPYRLLLSGEDGDQLQVECVTRKLLLSKKGWSVDPSFGAIPALACGFRSVESGEEWAMKLHNRSMNMTGHLMFSDGRTLPLQSVHRLEGSRISSADPVGFEIGSGQIFGAVEVVNRGRVWIDPSLGHRDRDRIAAAAAALLLYRDPSND
jgi:hypothetical protein